MSGENKYNCEYAVPKKSEGTYKVKRMVVKAMYILVPIAIIAVISIFMSYAAFVFVPLFAILARPVINGTWRYVNYDQRYEIRNAGTIRFTRYYGKKFRVEKNDEHAGEKIAEKFILEMKIKDFEVIAPYNDEMYRRAFDAAGIVNVIDHSSSPSNPNVYYGIYTDDKGVKSAVLFDMIDKTLGIMLYYNSETVKTELRFSGDKKA